MLKPKIILLDINMPKMNGFEFLTELRKDPVLNNILVYIFTTSDQAKDITMAHEYNVAGYLVKPTDISEMDQMLTTLTQTWQLMRFSVD